MGSVRIATLSLAAVLGSILVIGDASAKPVDRPASVTNQMADGKDVRWVCGPYTCWSTGPDWRGPHWDYDWVWHRRPYLEPRYYRWGFGGDWW